MHPIHLADVVEREVFVVTGQLQLELGTIVEHGFVQLVRTTAAGHEESKEQ